MTVVQPEQLQAAAADVMMAMGKAGLSDSASMLTVLAAIVGSIASVSEHPAEVIAAFTQVAEAVISDGVLSAGRTG